MEFKKLSINRKNLLEKHYLDMDYKSCEMSFASMYIWSKYFKTEFFLDNEFVIYKLYTPEGTFFLPIGKNLKPAILWLLDYCKRLSLPFKLCWVPREMFEEIDSSFPCKFKIDYLRASFDYIYSTEDLINLSGEKYHSKRNYINRFNKDYCWSYENITPENISLCYELLNEWTASAGQKLFLSEAETCKTALDSFFELGLSGGLLHIDDYAAAFSIGEKLTNDTFVVHVEKALPKTLGSYAVINREFLIHNAKNFTFVNREDDNDISGLRKSKLSYHPAFLLEKGIVTLKPN